MLLCMEALFSMQCQHVETMYRYLEFQTKSLACTTGLDPLKNDEDGLGDEALLMPRKCSAAASMPWQLRLVQGTRIIAP
jgi:hypothetical protein